MGEQGWLGLQGSICAVTGAGSGIGRSIAAAFAEAGASAALLDINAEAADAAASEIGRGAIAVACDVTDDDAVASACKSVLSAFGRCDVLVNNAAFLSAGGLAELDLAEWQRMLDVNLTGYLRCAQVFGAGMLTRGRGALVHIGSIAGTQTQGFSGAYSPCKAAVSMLSRQLALEWGARGVRSNVVSPGLVRTPLSERFYADPATRARREAMVPLRRIGDTREIAEAVLFLASPRAAYVTGQDLTVYGGLSHTLMSTVPRPGYEAG